MGPLSAKQHREYLKHEANENRKNSAFAKEQERKEQLHELKLKEAGAKASQGIAHKEENHAMKLAEGTMKVPRINRQQLGLPSMNPLSGSEVLGQGQKRLPGMIPKGTDTVPAMLTPGEAVIPAQAAQNPKNKKAIKKMVNEGRKANRKGVLGFADGTTDVSYYEDGTTNVSFLDRALNFLAGQKTEQTPPPVVTPVTAPVTSTQVMPVIPEPLLQAQRMVESNNMNVYPEGHPKAGQLVKSPVGALGIAQIMPRTAAKPGFDVPPLSMEDLKDPAKAMDFQSKYMAAMSKKYDGDIERALTAYNAGPGTVDKAFERATRAGKPESWKDYLPTQEAKEYANKVLSNISKDTSTAPLASPGTGFASNEGGAAFGNPNITRQAAKSLPRQEAIKSGEYQAVPNLAEATPAMKDVAIPDTKFEVPPVVTVPPVPTEAVQEQPVSQEVIKDTAAFDAMVAGFSQQVAPQIQEAAKQAETITDPVQKKSFLESFISNIYGKEGLFNERDLARFAVVAAGGLLTGGSTGGSLRFAGKDVLLNADKRNALEAQQQFEREKLKAVDERTERNKLIDQGYEPTNIDKYFKTRAVVDLGSPKTTYSFKETGKQYTIDRGPQSGMVFQVVEATTKTGKGSGDTTLMVVDPRTNTKVPLNSFQSNAQKMGYNVVDYSAATHSPTAKANRVKEWVEKDANTIADQAIEQVYGASNVKGVANKARANVPTSSAMGAQAASFFKSIGFEPSDSSEMLEGKNIMNVAVRDMINDQQTRKVKVDDLTPYLSRSMITVRSGINPDLFKIGVGDKAKVMPPEKIVQLDYLVKQASSDLGGGQTNSASQQALYQKMATAWTNNPKLREQYAKPGSEESSFYMFMKDTLSKGLKQ